MTTQFANIIRSDATQTSAPAPKAEKKVSEFWFNLGAFAEVNDETVFVSPENFGIGYNIGQRAEYNGTGAGKAAIVDSGNELCAYIDSLIADMEPGSTMMIQIPVQVRRVGKRQPAPAKVNFSGIQLVK
jgi:hypothetical protein